MGGFESRIQPRPLRAKKGDDSRSLGDDRGFPRPASCQARYYVGRPRRWPGTGIETHTRLLSEMFCTVGKPRAVVYGHSGLGRRLDYYDTDSGGVHSATFFPFISTKVIVNDGGSSRSAGRLTAWATRSDTEMRAWYEHNWCVFRGLCVDVPLISWCTMPEYEEMIRSVDSQCLPWPGKIDTGTDGLHPGVGWHRKAELSIRRRYQELV